MNTPLLPLVALSCAALFAACSSMQSDPSTVSVRDFGVDNNGRPATLWTLRNESLEIDVTDHGATLVAVRAPDRAGVFADVVLGFDDVRGYQSEQNQYFGCTTGRVCNRIANGRFDLDGYTYRLAINNPPNSLHGGANRSLDKVAWRAERVGDDASQGVRFSYLSRNGEEGFPGNLQVEVTYWLTGNTIKIDYRATTDQRTPVNLTNHTYWNLAGAGAATVLDHDLAIDADRYTKTDDTLIPTGEIASVLGTALDFTKPLPIGLRIASLDDTAAKGYDHNYVLRPEPGLRRVAALRHNGSGRLLDVLTTEPGLQLYSGNFLFGQTGKAGKSYAHRSGVCLETQHFPDSVNQPGFPSTLIGPDAPYESTTVYRLRVE